MSIASSDLMERLSFGLGDRLAKALKASGVSVQTMADELGVDRNTVGNYINGHTAPKRAVKIAWALRTGVPFEWLETGVLPGSPTTPEGGVSKG